MKPNELIEIARQEIQGKDADIARRLEITTAALSQIKTGKSKMPDRIAKKLAEIARLDPAATVAAIEAEKADDEMRGTWQEIARRAGAGTMVLMMVGMSFYTQPALVNPLKNNNFLESCPQIPIM